MHLWGTDSFFDLAKIIHSSENEFYLHENKN